MWYQLPVIGTGRKEVNKHQDSWVKYKIHTWLKTCPKMPGVSWPWCLRCKNQLLDLSARKSKFSSSNERMPTCETKRVRGSRHQALSCFHMGPLTWVSISIMLKEGTHEQLFISVTNLSDSFYIPASELNTKKNKKVHKIRNLDYANILYWNTLLEKQQRKWNTQNLCNIKEINSK